jgi:hypothetical protein
MESCSWGHLRQQAAEASGIGHKSACISIAQTNMLGSIVSIENSMQAFLPMLFPRGLNQSSRWQAALEVLEGMEVLVAAVMVDCPYIYRN